MAPPDSGTSLAPPVSRKMWLYWSVGLVWLQCKWNTFGSVDEWDQFASVGKWDKFGSVGEWDKFGSVGKWDMVGSVHKWTSLALLVSGTSFTEWNKFYSIILQVSCKSGSISNCN